jgi:hypothetical protein
VRERLPFWLCVLAVGAVLGGCTRRVPVSALAVGTSLEPREVSLSDTAARLVLRTWVRNPRWYSVEAHLGGPPIRFGGPVSDNQGTTLGLHIAAIPPDTGGWSSMGRVRHMSAPLYRIPPLTRLIVTDTFVVERGRLRHLREPGWRTRERALSAGRYEVRGSFNTIETPPETLVVRP